MLAALSRSRHLLITRRCALRASTAGSSRASIARFVTMRAIHARPIEPTSPRASGGKSRGYADPGTPTASSRAWRRAVSTMWSAARASSRWICGAPLNVCAAALRPSVARYLLFPKTKTPCRATRAPGPCGPRKRDALKPASCRSTSTAMSVAACGNTFKTRSTVEGAAPSNLRRLPPPSTRSSRSSSDAADAWTATSEVLAGALASPSDGPYGPRPACSRDGGFPRQAWVQGRILDKLSRHRMQFATRTRPHSKPSARFDDLPS